MQIGVDPGDMVATPSYAQCPPVTLAALLARNTTSTINHSPAIASHG